VKLREWPAALRDAVAALELSPDLARAKVAATDAASALDCGSSAEVQELLEVAGTGQILDRSTPLVVAGVERWVDNVVRAAEVRRDRRKPTASPPPAPDAGEDVQLDIAAHTNPAPRQSPVPVTSAQDPKVAAKVTPAYNTGFLYWISFLRAGDIDTDMDRDVWVHMIVPKLDPFNWKLICQRKGVDIGGGSPLDMVKRLVAAYSEAGCPPAVLAEKTTPPSTLAEHVLLGVRNSVPALKND